MTALFSWAPILVLLGFCGAVLAAIAGALFLRLTWRPMSRLAPTQRFGLLVLLAAAPFLGSVAVLSVAFVPSAFDALGLLADHCGHHVDHAFHLCFVHGSPPAATWPLATLVLVGALVSPALMSEARGWKNASELAARLRSVGSYNPSMNCWLLDVRGVAFTVGIFRPQVFVSNQACAELEPLYWRAVLAHEHEHRRRRDGLAKSVARLLCSFHLPWTRRVLLQQLDLASEHACDQSAAAVIGSSTAVASAIIAMQRLGQHQQSPLCAEAFGAHAVEARVRALLDERWARISPIATSAAVVALGALVAASHERLHHALETAFTTLF